MSDILVPKGQEQRVQRRLEKYRTRHDESIPRFEHTVNGINEQQKQETLLLRQRFLEPKSKKGNKKSDRKTPPQQPNESLTNAGPKVPKRERQCEDTIDITGQQNGPENYEPPTKVAHCNGGPSTSTSFKKAKAESSMTKFSLEIVHLAKSGSNSSTPNLKTSVKGPPVPTSSAFAPPNTLNIHLKQESNHVPAFADLDQCAAALEKDGTTSMGLIEGTPDGLIPSDTLKDLISEISDLNPDFMGDFDFEEDRPSQSTSQAPFSGQSHSLPVAPVTPSSPRHVKMESGDYPSSVESCRGLSHCAGPSPAAASTASPLSHPSHTPPYAAGIFETSSSPSGANHPSSGSSTPNPTYCPQTTTPPSGGAKPTRIPYTSPTPMGHDSPAAQTLKQMAEHHQHKQLGMTGNFKAQPSQSHPSPARSPFAGDAYSPFSGEFVSQGQPQFGNIRTQSGDGVVIKQENQGQGGYGPCPNYSHPTSPLDMNHPHPKRPKTPVTTMGHSKSFTQAHLNPHLPQSYRPSFSPPTSFAPINQPSYTHHKINQSQPMTLQQNTLLQVSGPGQHMVIGQDMKGTGLSLPHHHSTHYYQGMSMEGAYSSGQEQGQTINFTQQHLRMTQGGPPPQQPMGRIMGLSSSTQQPPTNQMDRSRLPPRVPTGDDLNYGGVEMSGMGSRVPMEIQHRMMMRGDMGGAQGNEMDMRFNIGGSSGPGRPQQQSHQQLMSHRQQTINPVYHHQQMTHQHMSPLRRIAPYQPPQENRISNQNLSQHPENRISNQTLPQQHQENWIHHPAHQEHPRPFHQQHQRPSNHQHFHLGMNHQQQSMSFPQHHHLSHAYPPQQNLKMSQSGSLCISGKNGGHSEEGGLVLKTETESSDFNLDLLEGEDFSFDASSNYQNILDSL